MSGFGKILQETREAKDISYEQIDRDLKIKRRYIEALEEENFTFFPSTPMVRGFIRNYAVYLELDPAEMLELYERNGAGFKRRGFRKGKGISFMEIPMTRSNSLINPDTLITVLLIVALLGSIFFFAYTQYLEPVEVEFFNSNRLETEQGLSDSTAPLILPTPTPLPPATPTLIPTSTPQYYTGVAVELVITQRSWIQILIDDVKVFDGFLEPGERRRWDGNKRVAIRSGNGGGVEIYVNGDYKGFMGEPGQVIDQVWEKVEAPSDAAPTATLTPSP